MSTAALSVRTLAGRLARARSREELCATFVDLATDAMGCVTRGIYLHDPDGRPTTAAVAGAPDSMFGRYEEIGRELDPLLPRVLTEHLAVSARGMLGDAAWEESPLLDHVLAPAGLDDYLTVPLLGRGTIIGTMGFGRARGGRPFTPDEVLRGATLGHHMSALVARLPTAPEAELPLTPRDREIVALVGRGLTNGEIGLELHISVNTVKQTLKRIFARLGVRSRAELVARAAR
ncbi:hypothetical protein GCM10009836_69740 [Pseudonocardia ailaonensis]|uniref:HTH luxR-type domain-containing protein n=1 Tax=Pseudonocardia ailaonensis TaxID=367279 RepID=A0ABN2NQY6_9PSEU